MRHREVPCRNLLRLRSVTPSIEPTSQHLHRPRHPKERRSAMQHRLQPHSQTSLHQAEQSVIDCLLTRLTACRHHRHQSHHWLQRSGPRCLNQPTETQKCVSLICKGMHCRINRTQKLVLRGTDNRLMSGSVSMAHTRPSHQTNIDHTRSLRAPNRSAQALALTAEGSSATTFGQTAL